jgi:hypothetical protein
MALPLWSDTTTGSPVAGLPTVPSRALVKTMGLPSRNKLALPLPILMRGTSAACVTWVFWHEPQPCRPALTMAAEQLWWLTVRSGATQAHWVVKIAPLATASSSKPGGGFARVETCTAPGLRNWAWLLPSALHVCQTREWCIHCIDCVSLSVAAPLSWAVARSTWFSRRPSVTFHPEHKRVEAAL